MYIQGYLADKSPGHIFELLNWNQGAQKLDGDLAYGAKAQNHIVNWIWVQGAVYGRDKVDDLLQKLVQKTHAQQLSGLRTSARTSLS